MGLHDPAGETFRASFCGLWIAEDETKVLAIRQDEAGRVWVDIGTALGRRDIGTDMVANWEPRDPDKEASPIAWARLDKLSVETGQVGFDRTYELLFAQENEDPDAFGGLCWIPVRPDTPREAVRLFPDTGPSFLDAVTWQDDEGYVPWAEPLSTYRPATEDEVARDG